MVRSTYKIAMYTKIQIRYNVLISRKLLYPITLWSKDAKHWNFYRNSVWPTAPLLPLLGITQGSQIRTSSSMESNSTLKYGMEGDPNCTLLFNTVLKLPSGQEGSLISSWSLSGTRQGPEDWLLCLKDPGTCPFYQSDQSGPHCNFQRWCVLLCFDFS